MEVKGRRQGWDLTIKELSTAFWISKESEESEKKVLSRGQSLIKYFPTMVFLKDNYGEPMHIAIKAQCWYFQDKALLQDAKGYKKKQVKVIVLHA